MGEFNYKKWVVENKFGKEPTYSTYSTLNEQTGSGAITYYGCSFCPQGAVPDLVSNPIYGGPQLGFIDANTNFG